MERRKFCRNFTLGGSILLSAPVLFNSCSDDSSEEEDNIYEMDGIKVDLTSPEYAALKNVGGFAYKDDIIIIRYSKTAYIALSKLCTHEKCIVTYNTATNELPCPCHGSKFTKEGTVVNGPPDIVADLTSPSMAALKTVGGYAYKDDVIIIRSTETSYLALSKLCTHSQCTITFNKTTNNLNCPCHGSKFATTGNVTNGPATSSLRKFDTKINGSNLIISTPMNQLKKYDVKQIGNFLLIT